MTQAQYQSGYIYRNVIEKRLDDASYEMSLALQKSYIDAQGKLVFIEEQGFEKAIQDGIFMLEIPQDLDLKDCDIFAQHFYQKPEEATHEYAEFRGITAEVFDDPLLGFHERVDQIEQFLLERRFWSEYYPKSISHVAERLCQISGCIIDTVFKGVGIPQAERAVASGGCTVNAGSYHMTFNHFRTGIDKKGLSSHKDDGFITILRTVTPGLEVNRQDRWERVGVDKNYFIINFGLAMEILTAESQMPVSAIMHRVAQQSNERWSWGHFSSSTCVAEKDNGIYKFSSNHGLQKICDSRELINNNDYEIYNGTVMDEQ